MQDINNENKIEDIQIGEEFEEKPIAVYVKVNEEGYVTDVNSDIFIQDFTGWQKIDEGSGDKYAHAQSQYFDSPLTDEFGNYLLKK